MIGRLAPVISVMDPALTVTWIGTDGNPANPPGALQVDIPYSTASQYVGVGVSLPTTMKLDLSGKILRANVKVASGLGDPQDLLKNPGGVKLYLRTGPAYVFAAGFSDNITTVGTWVAIEFDPLDPGFVDMSNDAGTFDASDVRELGIQLDTGGMAPSAIPAVVVIDTVTY